MDTSTLFVLDLGSIKSSTFHHFAVTFLHHQCTFLIQLTEKFTRASKVVNPYGYQNVNSSKRNLKMIKPFLIQGSHVVKQRNHKQSSSALTVQPHHCNPGFTTGKPSEFNDLWYKPKLVFYSNGLFLRRKYECPVDRQQIGNLRYSYCTYSGLLWSKK